MERLRDESGWSLMEFVFAAALMVLVLGTALTPFQVFQTTDRDQQNTNDALDTARTTLDYFTHQLRNVAGQSQLINRASSYDIVFETVDSGAKPAGSQNTRNLMRVRYCLNTTTAPSSVTSARLYEQKLTWTTAAVPSSMPNANACPDAAWGTTTRAAADFITNRATSATAAGVTRRAAEAPLFAFYPVPASNPPTAAQLQAITQIRMDLFVDRSATERPFETELASGVFLRNQNGPPTATFTAVAGGAVGSKKITLNATGSSDPENLPLTYRWCDVTTVTTCDDTTKVGTGVLYTYTAPVSGTRKILLQVFDNGGLETDLQNNNVTAP
jgi:type II secretory pathway pseudopilin PulG